MQAFDPSLLQDRDEAGFGAELAAAAGAGELVVHYQPIVSVADDRCVAVEALVRWQHPRRGLLGPAEFIGIAERTGAVGDIGAFVLRQACADAAAWTGPDGRLAVHVNVSAAQLTDPGFLDVVRGCLAEHGRPPDTLVLEITEGMVLDSAPVRYALDRLAALGVCIAIDDFGTGYSALSTLRTLPLDIVKLDKSFLTNGPAQAADEAVVAAIVQMAGRLGLCVVAEGVERPDQQRLLRCVRIDAAQGPLHLRPTSADRFGRWLSSRSADDRPTGTVTPIGRRIG
jgi:EAL domain-containing protein (putative c-di-GMP-specific phosphodiesterase class I)